MRKNGMRVCAGTLMSLILTTLAFGNGFEIYPQGAKAVGMAGAFTAQADDPTAIFYNPAGITQLKGTQVSLGVSVIRPEMTFESHGNPAMGSYPGQETESKDRTWLIPNGYLTHKINDLFSIGLGSFSDFGLGVEWSRGFEGRFSPGTVKTVLTTNAINPVIAIAPVRWASFGVGPVLRYMDIHIQNFVFIGPPAPPLTPNRNLARTAAAELKGSDWAWGWNAGLLLHLPESFHFGASYRSRVSHEIKGGKQEISLLTNGALVKSQDASSKITLPSSVRFGLAWKKDPWTLEADAQWMEWSTYGSLAAQFADGTSTSVPKNWHNSWTYMLGAQYALSRYFDLRAGFRYAESPIPNDTLDPLVPSGIRKSYCCGVGSHFGPFTIDLGYNYVQDENRKWNNHSGDVNVGPVTLTRVSGRFKDGDAHVLVANITCRF